MMTLLTAKDIMHQLQCSRATAYRYISEIKETYDIKTKRITQDHLNLYFGIVD
ncbi:HTH domain-containing protein [Pontimicrobium aquaticum]|uniref:HTH domain-containing protein n=1 Tax=Pontimicrobium aquaticum TaxID=2565367 RepID=A0A4U0EP40_9FLAO|nr:HTH domain-containing protein [Pontimicrobium aquaticum]TJY33387.1 HTH domain-containing protein [Pontimicrobium aquaticum]